MPTYTFPVISFGKPKIGKCPACGRNTRKSATFTQTMHPWNLNAQGEPKTSSEIFAELRQEWAAWVPDFRHEACKP